MCVYTRPSTLDDVVLYAHVHTAEMRILMNTVVLSTISSPNGILYAVIICIVKVSEWYMYILSHAKPWPSAVTYARLFQHCNHTSDHRCSVQPWKPVAHFIWTQVKIIAKQQRIVGIIHTVSNSLSSCTTICLNRSLLLLLPILWWLKCFLYSCC